MSLPQAISWLAAACLLGMPGLAARADTGQGLPLESVAAIDVPRYLGRWYEIAKFPNSFQRECVGSTYAEYGAKPDGNLQVINRCRLASGETKEAIGTAYQVGGPTAAKLKVRFAPAWLGFLPFVWGDYWVIDLDADYQLVAVSEPQREYLWILSRTPTVAASAYTALLQRLQAKGFDLIRLEETRQRP